MWMRQRHKDRRPVGDIIDEISALMRFASGDDLLQLAHHLEHFLVVAGREEEALQVLDRMIGLFPDDVRLPISKATVNLYFANNPDEALKCIDLALDRADRTLLFRREALGVKARILLKLGRGEELSDVLEEIMSMQMVKGIADVGRERDFVDRAPPGLIRADVLARYDQFRPPRSSDTTADEPPKFEPPEWE